MQPQRIQLFAGEMRALKAFLAERQIPFGVILWSSHAPVRTDKEYFDDTMDFARQINSIVGRPDELVFSSWTKRCEGPGKCDKPNQSCPGVDPSDCGKMSVPINMPGVAGSKYTHTNLIPEALGVFGH